MNHKINILSTEMPHEILNILMGKFGFLVSVNGVFKGVLQWKCQYEFANPSESKS